jgi:hypothetical protein
MKTALVIMVCALFLLAACGQKSVTPTDNGTKETVTAQTGAQGSPSASAEVSDADVNALSTSIDNIGDTNSTGLDSLDSDFATIDSLDI